jgi:hypothetical protein
MVLGLGYVFVRVRVKALLFSWFVSRAVPPHLLHFVQLSSPARGEDESIGGYIFLRFYCPK